MAADGTLSEFFAAYFRTGFECVFTMSPSETSHCEFSLFYIVGYVVSIFVV